MKYQMQYELQKMGKITLLQEDTFLTHIFFGWDSPPAGTLPPPTKETALFLQVKQQLEEYLAGTRRAFSLPLLPQGTPFQEKVWQALLEIPYGETRSYQQTAIAIKTPKACRAIGMANHHNPIPIVIPCHRVIGADGSLTGYGGGLQIKKFLLTLEEENR